MSGHEHKHGAHGDTPLRIEAALAFSKHIQREVQLPENSIVLDFGCGSGIIGLDFLPIAGKVVFLDPAPGQIECTKEKLSKQTRSNYEIVQGFIDDYHGDKVVDFLPGAAFFERMKPNMPYYGFKPEQITKFFVDAGFINVKTEEAAEICHIQEDGSKECYARFALFAEAP